MPEPLDVGALVRRIELGVTVTLPGRASTSLWMLLGCIAFTAGGAAMIIVPLTSLPFGSGRWDGPFTMLVGAAAVLFFGVMGGSAAVHGLRRRRVALVLEPAGLRCRGSALVAWQEVHGIAHASADRQGALLLQLSEEGDRAWTTGVAPTLRWLHRRSRSGAPLPAIAGIEAEPLGHLLEHARGLARR